MSLIPLSEIADESPAVDTAMLSTCLDASPVPAYVINTGHIVLHWNKACERLTGVDAPKVIGTREHWRPFHAEGHTLADAVLAHTSERGVDSLYPHPCRPAGLGAGSYEAENFFPHIGEQGTWLLITAVPMRDSTGKIVGVIETLQDITVRKNTELSHPQAEGTNEPPVTGRIAQLTEDIQRRTNAESELLRRNKELTELNEMLSKAQEQLVQSDKLASIGQLAAGVAHEINNPIGYVFSNFGSLENYLSGLFEMLSAYEEAEAAIASNEIKEELRALREKVDLDFLKQDIPLLMNESKEGIARVRKIVQDLKDFSRVDTSQEWQWVNLHHGIDSTLNIVNNEIKYKADVVKQYGDLPDVECLPTQINQVIMNLLVNASHAMGAERGTITVSTGRQGEEVWIEVADTGAGIPKENLSRIFDPFFTTKPIGKGTGLGLSLSYGIIQKHHGRIEVQSELNKGTTFRITLPIHQSPSDGGKGT